MLLNFFSTSPRKSSIASVSLAAADEEEGGVVVVVAVAAAGSVCGFDGARAETDMVLAGWLATVQGAWLRRCQGRWSLSIWLDEGAAGFEFCRPSSSRPSMSCARSTLWRFCIYLVDTTTSAYCLMPEARLHKSGRKVKSGRSTCRIDTEAFGLSLRPGAITSYYS